MYRLALHNIKTCYVAVILERFKTTFPDKEIELLQE